MNAVSYFKLTRCLPETGIGILLLSRPVVYQKYTSVPTVHSKEIFCLLEMYVYLHWADLLFTISRTDLMLSRIFTHQKYMGENSNRRVL